MPIFKRFNNYSIFNLDINECFNNNGGCSHFCHNTFGGFYCSCNENEDLDVDNRTCIGIKPAWSLHSAITYNKNN